MSKYSDFDAEDVRGKVRLTIIIVGFAIIGLLEWVFGHPTEKELGLALGLLLFVIVLEYLESLRQYVTKLNELAKDRHKELRDDLAKLRTDLTDKLRDLDKSVSKDLRDLDKAVFDLSLKVGD